MSVSLLSPADQAFRELTATESVAVALELMAKRLKQICARVVDPGRNSVELFVRLDDGDKDDDGGVVAVGLGASAPSELMVSLHES
jgi:hypothetical protein